MTLSEQLNAMQAVLQQVSSELKEMQMQVEKLESENERLRQRITPAIAKNKDTASGQKALQKLYDEGYHVCPSYFGREHDGGCLFCLEVLKIVTK